MTVRVGVERDGPRVVLTFRASSGASATLDLHRRGAASLAALTAAAADPDDDGAELECELRAELTTTDPKETPSP